MLSHEDFRRIALGMDDAVESAHMGHPDFRVSGGIFATIHSDHQHGMLKLTPDQQKKFVHDYPATFVPENGAWGRAGSTSVRLDLVEEEILGEVMTLAWQNIAAKRVTARLKSKRTARREHKR
jgi:hypothetical protein